MSARIGFPGLGAVGSRMAVRLLQSGLHVTMWNRNHAPVQALLAAWAQAAANPRQAAQDADFVIAMGQAVFQRASAQSLGSQNMTAVVQP